MRDPTVNVAVEKAIAEAVKVFAFYKNSWLKPTTLDWSDVDLRMEARLRVARMPMPEDVRAVIYARLDEAKPLPRGRGRHQAGECGPRNVVIVRVLAQLKRHHGFKPVKTGSHSGSFIVRQALKRVGIKLAERTVEAIWANRPRSLADIRSYTH